MDYSLQILLTLFSLLGLGLTLVGLPGIVQITVSLLIYGVTNEFSNPPVYVYIIFIVLTVLSSLIDNFMTLFGAKKSGSSKFGLLGAFIGGIIGFFVFPPIGALFGTFFGSILFELAVTKNIEKAFRIGIGTMVGYFGSILVKFVLALSLFIWFMFILW